MVDCRDIGYRDSKPDKVLLMSSIVTAQVVHSKTRQPIRWAFATKFRGVVDTKMVDDAAALAQAEKRKNPQLAAWMIDATGVTDITDEAKIRLFIQLVALRGLGVGTAGIVLPVLGESSMKKVQSQLPSGAKIFLHLADCQSWFDASCPK